MNCPEVREFLFAFLDNELDSGLSIGIQRHLESCCACGHEAEIERTVRRSLVDKLETGAQAPRLDDAQILTLLHRGPTERTPRQLLGIWKQNLYAVGQALVLLAGLAAGVRFSTGRGRRPGNHFADMLVTGHEVVAHGGEPVDLRSGDPASVASWINQKQDWDVKIAPPRDTHKLLGARTCMLSGRPAAQALYEVNGTPVSLVILRNEAGDLAEMNEVDHVGTLGRHFHGHTIVARRCGNLTYAAVGQAPEEQLAHLIPLA